MDVILRVLAATIGAYALSSAGFLALARGLPIDPRDAMSVASMTSYLLFAAIVILAFSTRSGARAWAGIAIALLPLGLFLLFNGGAER